MDFSIIIPCYNSGKYLPDALNSIKPATKGGKFVCEVIIIDDGSTDPLTKDLLARLETQGYIVVSQKNGGPAAARNTGIRIAKGKYFIFLDSDNKLKPDFIEKTLELQQRANADIIHCQPDFFGDTTEPRFQTGYFDINKIVVQNYIDICCLIRREVFEKVGGFDEDRLMRGFEDWEFFLHAYSEGFTFQFVKEPVYDYRVLGSSLSQQHTYEHIQRVKHYVYQKYIGLVTGVFEWYYMQHRMYVADRRRPVRSFAKYMYNRYWLRRP